jgi:hypothetical protein
MSRILSWTPRGAPRRKTGRRATAAETPGTPGPRDADDSRKREAVAPAEVGVNYYAGIESEADHPG